MDHHLLRVIILQNIGTSAIHTSPSAIAPTTMEFILSITTIKAAVTSHSPGYTGVVQTLERGCTVANCMAGCNKVRVYNKDKVRVYKVRVQQGQRAWVQQELSGTEVIQDRVSSRGSGGRGAGEVSPLTSQQLPREASWDSEGLSFKYLQ